MALEFVSAVGRLEEQNVECIVASSFEGKLSKEAERVDKMLNNEISNAMKRKEFEGKSGTLMVLRTLGKLKQRKIVIIGLGKEKEYNKQSAENASALAFQAVKNDCESVAFKVSHSDLKTVVESAIVSLYDYQEWKTADKKDAKAKKVLLVFDSEGEKRKAEQTIVLAKTMGFAQNYCREINNVHPGIANPAFMASQAQKIAGGKVKVTVWGKKELEHKGYNGILSVGKGSVNEPKLVVMEYSGGRQGEKPFAIVGKGVCFDSGGISLKPSRGMDKMRYDKSGACTVIATIKALKELNWPVNVVGIAPFVENLPSGSSYKPGDVVKTASGKTVEITNTDAEGRVILSDALYHASQLKPKGIIDFATLTGACVVALGTHAAGLLTNDNTLASKVKKAADESGERVWELPMWDDYKDLIKSDVADMRNADERSDAGATEGGLFLKEFVGEGIPWVHLDIAGTAYVESPTTLVHAGATGWGVKLLLEFFRKEMEYK